MVKKLTGSVGIFGGSFNPITTAHVQITKAASKQFNLAWLMFEPTNNFYNKNGLQDVEHRINMIQEVFDDSELFNGTTFSVGAVDALAAEKMYTYQLLQRYRNMFRTSKLFFILGSDNLKEFHTWRQPEKVFELSNLIVFGRGTDDIPEIINKNPILSKNVGKIHELKLKRNSLSASLIRNWLQNPKSNISSRYLPRKVLNYIREHKLYEK